MADEIRTISDLEEWESDAEATLELTGGICNLLQSDLRIVDAYAHLRCVYPRDTIGPAEVVWQDNYRRIYAGETGLAWENVMRRKTAPELTPMILSGVRKIGSFNRGYVDLVEPVHDLTDLLRFWKQAVKTQHAEQARLPNMKSWTKQAGMKLYCVVSVGVALTAYYRWEDISMLLVPVCPHLCDDGGIGYEALMPAQCLLKDQADRGIWR